MPKRRAKLRLTANKKAPKRVPIKKTYADVGVQTDNMYSKLIRIKMQAREFEMKMSRQAKDGSSLLQDEKNRMLHRKLLDCNMLYYRYEHNFENYYFPEYNVTGREVTEFDLRNDMQKYLDSLMEALKTVLMVYMVFREMDEVCAYLKGKWEQLRNAMYNC